MFLYRYLDFYKSRQLCLFILCATTQSVIHLPQQTPFPTALVPGSPRPTGRWTPTAPASFSTSSTCAGGRATESPPRCTLQIARVRRRHGHSRLDEHGHGLQHAACPFVASRISLAMQPAGLVFDPSQLIVARDGARPAAGSISYINHI